MLKIGIYDSGCGGLSVLNHLLHLINNKVTKSSSDATHEKWAPVDIVYYSDSKHNPWGSKPKASILTYLTTIATFFKQESVNHVITGCNTSIGMFSKYELTTLFNAPVTTLFDHTAHHYHESKYSVLCTENTYKSGLFDRFLGHINREIEVIPCPDLAHTIETGQLDTATHQLVSAIQSCTHPSIILGCTHYPLILPYVKHQFDSKRLIDPATCLSSSMLPEHSHIESISFTTSGSLSILAQHIQRFTSIQESTIKDLCITSQIEMSAKPI